MAEGCICLKGKSPIRGDQWMAIYYEMDSHPDIQIKMKTQ